MAFALLIRLSLSQATRFFISTFPILFSIPLWGEWASGCIGFGCWLGLNNDRGKDLFCSLGTFSVYQSLLVGFYLLSHMTSLLLKILLNPYLGGINITPYSKFIYIYEIYSNNELHVVCLCYYCWLFLEMLPGSKKMFALLWIFKIFLLEKVKQFGCQMKEMTAIHVHWFVRTKTVFSSLKRNNARVR